MQTPVQRFEISEVEIVYKRKNTKSPKITDSKMAADIFRSQFPQDKMDYKEFFYVMLLSQSNEVLGVSQIGIGSTTATVVNIKEIFQLALKSNCTGIILAHNHPSGSLQASVSDKKLTRKIQECGEFMDCRLLDHIILTSEDYFSFSDNGEL